MTDNGCSSGGADEDVASAAALLPTTLQVSMKHGLKIRAGKSTRWFSR